jgi:hypothetical protein
MTRNTPFACCCIAALALAIGQGCTQHHPAASTRPTATAAAAAADIQSPAIAPRKPKAGLLTGTLQLSPTANFPIDAQVRITARYFDGDPVVIGQTFNDVRKWPIRFELQLPQKMSRYYSIRISARAELDGRTILVTEEKHCYIDRGDSSDPLDLILMPAVE